MTACFFTQGRRVGRCDGEATHRIWIGAPGASEDEGMLIDVCDECDPALRAGVQEVNKDGAQPQAVAD